MKRMLAAAVLLAVVFGAAGVFAHEITVKGTVASVEPTRLQVRTGEEKKDQAPAWYPIDGKTKIRRGDKPVAFADAKIKVGERVVVLLDHQANGTMKALEVRLAAE